MMTQNKWNLYVFNIKINDKNVIFYLISISLQISPKKITLDQSCEKQRAFYRVLFEITSFLKLAKILIE